MFRRCLSALLLVTAVGLACSVGCQLPSWWENKPKYLPKPFTGSPDVVEPVAYPSSGSGSRSSMQGSGSR